MRRLPSGIQWLLTELTGKAPPGEKPPFRWTALGRFLLSLAVLTLGLALSTSAVFLGGVLTWFLLPPGWLFTVAAIRTWQTSFIHHAGHGNFLKHRKCGQWLAEFLSALIWAPPLSRYAPEHKLHHAFTATLKDVDLLFLVTLGFQPGRTVAQYWRQFFKMLISPKFHLTYAWFRLKVNFDKDLPRGRRVASLLWLMTLVISIRVTGMWWEFLLVWLIPVGPVFQIAGLCQLLTEHNWVRVGSGQDPAKVVLARLTNARFFGEALPEKGSGGTLRWWVRLFTIHLPQRLIVAPADLANHDWHHRKPGGDWPNAAYARRDEVEKSSGDLSKPKFTEKWGFGAAADETFRLVSSLPKEAVLGKPLTYEARMDAMTEM